ncbi:TorD/DmsD family molecular chaperone [Palleronia caenipelagi]|uniref:Molecular chaperone TorD family protein n=1 Tax=Palleronia caenipelagi TaxID=2489174 RepID=A0A547Q9E0_9RHOB|nr:molecular chaperone TorD family protein [Palleronia caenipelagi]TRD23015.1 molecular chaperone TorD family protein [Palleronia caenipelagi]
MTAMPQHAIDDVDRARADLYNFLGLLLARPADQMLIDQTAGLTGDDTEIGAAIAALTAEARKTTPAKVEREFTALFIGLGRGELLPFASYYLTGFLHEKPLALVRQDMARLGLARADTVFEPEDSIASLMESMGAMIVGRFGPPATLSEQKEFFARHIAPWAGHFFADLEEAKTAQFYAPVGRLGRLFVAIEAEGFRLDGQDKNGGA